MCIIARLHVLQHGTASCRLGSTEWSGRRGRVEVLLLTAGLKLVFLHIRLIQALVDWPTAAIAAHKGKKAAIIIIYIFIYSFEELY